MVNYVEFRDAPLHELGGRGTSQRVGTKLLVYATGIHDGLGVLGHWFSSADWSVRSSRMCILRVTTALPLALARAFLHIDLLCRTAY